MPIAIASSGIPPSSPYSMGHIGTLPQLLCFNFCHKCPLHLATFGASRNVSAENLLLRLVLDSVGCGLPESLLEIA